MKKKKSLEIDRHGRIRTGQKEIVGEKKKGERITGFPTPGPKTSGRGGGEGRLPTLHFIARAGNSKKNFFVLCPGKK